jgi:hypothetical protein
MHSAGNNSGRPPVAHFGGAGTIVQNAGCDYGPGVTNQERANMNVLGFVAFVAGFFLVMWTLSKLMTDRNDAPAS